MNPCPDLSTLDDVSFDERDAHLATCSACRMLFAMRQGGDEEFSSDCEEAETLLAVACDTTLNAIDQRRLTRHIESCARCTALASERLLWDDTAPAEEIALTKRWQPYTAYASTAEPANDQRSPLFYGVALLVAAAAIFLVLRGLTGSSEGDGNDSRADLQQKTPSTQVLDPRESDSDNTSVGASRPAPVVLAPPGLTVAELVAKSSEAIRDTDYARGLQLCEAALKTEPANQSALVNCAIATCNLNDSEAARGHIAGIVSSARAQGVTQICLRLGVEVQGKATASADELADQASSMINDKNFEGAKMSCLKALMLEPENETARTLCVIATCNLGDAEEAQYHFEKLESDVPRSVVKKSCSRLGVELVVDVAEAASTETSLEELVEQTEGLVKNTQYGKGLRLAMSILEREPDNQRALTAAVVASCNMKKSAEAKKYAAQITSQARRQGLRQVCMRLGMSLEEDETVKGPPPAKTGPSIDEMVDQAEAAVRETQYGKGSKLCRQVLESDPDNQRALTVCAISACNLKGTSAAKKYVRKVKSAQRRQGLQQICLRLGVIVGD